MEIGVAKLQFEQRFSQCMQDIIKNRLGSFGSSELSQFCKREFEKGLYQALSGEEYFLRCFKSEDILLFSDFINVCDVNKCRQAEKLPEGKVVDLVLLAHNHFCDATPSEKDINYMRHLQSRQYQNIECLMGIYSFCPPGAKEVLARNGTDVSKISENKILWHTI